MLIADGAPEDRAALLETLMLDQTARFSVIEAETGDRALELGRERSPDCLILDECLPDLSAERAPVSQPEGADAKRAEEQLRLLKTAIEQGAESVIITTAQFDPPGPQIVYVNPAFTKMTGYAPEEVIGKTPLILHGPKTDRAVLDRLRKDLEEGRVSFGETVNYRKDGSEFYLEWSFGPVRNERGEVTHFIATQRDITGRKRAEEMLRESEARFRLLADAMPQIVYTSTPDGALDYVNQQWREYVGAAEDVAGYGWMEGIHPDDRERTWSQWMKSLATGQPLEEEFRVRRKNGQYCWHLNRTIPIRDERGRIVKWIGTLTDIHDRKQAEAEREELLAREQAAREVAEAANRSKDEFLTVVSHELRTPLNAMLGYARLLRYGPPDARKVGQAVDIIERNGKAQSRLIDDLLDTAGIISGQLKLDVGPVNLVAVVQDAVRTIYPAAEAKGVSIGADLKPEAGQITGDPARLQQVVWNLLSNAVKFTSAGGRVEARLERIDPHVCVIVSDTGKGISPDFLPYVFDRFRQADASSVRRYGGLGLGLSLVKYLVELHGGTIEASSAGEGRGATFKVLLPVRAVYSPLAEDEVAPVAVSGLEGTITLAGVRAMVVDDETDARELVESALSQYGADVVAASSAAEAYELITASAPRERPDAMVTDLGMPDEDGFSLLRRVREWERERGLYIPAVALTAYGRTEDRVRALRAGFQMHVAKPVEPAELAAVIASLVKRSERGEKT
jgi:PAS domain S-box-containing protein